MKKRGAFLVVAVLAGSPFSACKRTTDVAVVVDLAHSQVGQPEGKEGVKYSVRPAHVLKVDARSFDWSTSLFPDARPNAIQLLIGKEKQYSAPWDASGLTTLSTNNLAPMNDSTAFPGLLAGDHAILAIGEQRIDEVKHQIVLKALWVGLVDVER